MPVLTSSRRLLTRRRFAGAFFALFSFAGAFFFAAMAQRLLGNAPSREGQAYLGRRFKIE